MGKQWCKFKQRHSVGGEDEERIAQKLFRSCPEVVQSPALFQDRGKLRNGDEVRRGLFERVESATETTRSAGAMSTTRSLRWRWSLRSSAAIVRKRNGVVSPWRSNQKKPRPAAMSCCAMERKSELLPVPVLPAATATWICAPRRTQPGRAACDCFIGDPEAK